MNKDHSKVFKSIFTGRTKRKYKIIETKLKTIPKCDWNPPIKPSAIKI